jgi:hypothetical protein
VAYKTSKEVLISKEKAARLCKANGGSCRSDGESQARV